MKIAYAVVTAIFILVALFTRYWFYWNENQFVFLMIIYLIVVIGVKLDEIARQLQQNNELLAQYLEKQQRSAAKPASGRQPVVDALKTTRLEDRAE